VIEIAILAHITQLFGAVVIVNHIPSCTSAGSALQHQLLCVAVPFKVTMEMTGVSFKW
jgi:hypothetical protein